MRDLQKDLEKWITDYDIGALGEWFYMIGEYIERAIKAEAEVAKYKRALELVSQYIDKELYQCPIPLPHDCHDNCLDCMPQYFLEQVDKEGE